MSRRGRRPAVLVVAMVLVRSLAAAEPAIRVLTYEDDALTVRLENAPLDEVLTRLGRESGAEIRGQVMAPRSVSAEFERVPLADALHRLLGEQNFALRYTRDGGLRIVELLGGAEPPAVLTAATPEEAPAPVAADAPVLPRRFANHRPLAVPERLGEALGSDTATFDEIFDVATNEEDGVTRAQAMQVALGALERERVLRRSLFVELRRGREGGLAEFLQSPRSIEILEYFAAHSREPALQKKAANMLEELRERVRSAPAGS